MSARRLSIDRIDLYYLHSGRAKDASFEDQVGTLAEMRKEGMISQIGLSNVTAGQLRQPSRSPRSPLSPHISMSRLGTKPLSWTQPSPRAPSSVRGSRSPSHNRAPPQTPAARKRSGVS